MGSEVRRSGGPIILSINLLSKTIRVISMKKLIYLAVWAYLAVIAIFSAIIS